MCERERVSERERESEGGREREREREIMAKMFKLLGGACGSIHHLNRRPLLCRQKRPTSVIEQWARREDGTQDFIRHTTSASIKQVGLVLISKHIHHHLRHFR